MTTKRIGGYAAVVALLASLLVSGPAQAGPGDERTTPWTVLIYGAADNNADGPILDFLAQIREEWDEDPGLEILLFLDRSEGFSDDAEILGEDFTGARLYRLRRGSAERLAGGEEFPEITLDAEWECDSADPENIRKFIAFGKRNFPAQRYGLMIYSHADGRMMCPDEQSGRDMGIAELTDVVGEEQSVDFLALELCNMGGIEIAYQWRPGNGGFYAETLLAIPNAGPPLDWHRAFRRIRSGGGDNLLDPKDMTAQAFGALVIEEGYAGRREMAAEIAKKAPERAGMVAFEAAALYDLGAAEEVKLSIDDLAVALVEHDLKDAFENIRGTSVGGCCMNYVMDQFLARPYVDLYDLCRRAAGAETLPVEVREKAARAAEAVDAFVLASFGMPGLEGFEAGKNGVFIVFPDGDSLNPRDPLSGSVWKDLGWYTPHEGDSESDPYGNWAWCAEGATEGNDEVENWFEMLDLWFDTTSPRGGYNYYSP